MNDNLTRDLGRLLRSCPGKCKVSVPVVSPTENTAIEAPSKGIGVAITEDLIRGIEALGKVTYTLN